MDASKSKQSKAVNQNLKVFLEDNELSDMVNVFHIESKDFDPNIYLDTFHLKEADKELQMAQKLLRKLRRLHAFDMAPEIKKTLLISSSPLLLENYQQLKQLYTVLMTKKLKENSDETIFTNSVKDKLAKVILTLNKINISLASQKSDLTNYSLLRKVNDKLFPYRTTKINQISRLIQFKNLNTLTLFLKDVHLK